MYQALYRKWRPRTFDEVVGQEHITSILRSQVERERLSHAYLFTGTRGTGKTSCAKILSRAANCQAPVGGNPCNKCPACLGIENGSVLDVMEFDAASNSRVDDIRQVLEETVYTPAFGKKRVYIIDEVHMLSTSAFNALLKTLEEPPEHLMFILATTEQHKVPATIVSRCQRFAFRRIAAELLKSRLLTIAQTEGIKLTDSGAELICRIADGSVRDALSLLDQCSGLGGGQIDEDAVAEATGLMGASDGAELLDAVISGDTAKALRLFDGLYMTGKEASAILDELLLLCRDLLILKKAPESAGVLSSPAIRGGLEKSAKSVGDSRLMTIINGIQNTRRAIQFSSNRRVDGELCMAMLCGAETRSAAESRPAQSQAAQTERKGHESIPQSAPEEKMPVAAAAKPSPAREPAAKAPQDAPSAQPSPTARTEPSQAEQKLPEVPGADWDRILEQAEPKLGIAEYFTLSNAALVKPRFTTDKLIIEVDSEFNLTTLRQPRIESVLRTAAGLPVEIRLAGDDSADGFGQLLQFGRENPGVVKIF